jgi:ketosteroid isomerase-like protein
MNTGWTRQDDAAVRCGSSWEQRLPWPRRPAALVARGYEAWGNVEAAVEEVFAGAGHVVSVLNYKGRGRESGVHVAIRRTAGVRAVRDGQVVRAAWFRSRDEALEAAGAQATSEDVG